MTTNKPGSVNQQPLYGCTSCYEDYTWPSHDLRVHGSECWCGQCWDERGWEFPDQPSWNDLEPYKPAVAVPDGFREIVEAVAHIGVDFGYGNFALSQEHIEKARALIEAAPSHSQQSAEPSVLVPECFKKLYDHARGMRFGTDWNNGTAARHNRQPLIDATWECEKWLSVAPSHSHQSADKVPKWSKDLYVGKYYVGKYVGLDPISKSYVVSKDGEYKRYHPWQINGVPDRCPSHESEKGEGEV